MSESLLEGLLHDILGIFSRACHAPRDEENLLLKAFDQKLVIHSESGRKSLSRLWISCRTEHGG
jgi:hypothetical protein